MNLKKLLALALAAIMILSIVACTPNDNTNGNTNGNTNNGGDGTGGGTVTKKDTYTYNYSLSVFPTNWNYFTYQTSTDAEILDYIVDGFYQFDYNETMDGYQMTDAMAVGDPVDVTADYIGKFGITEGSENLAWKVTLRQDLKWENGDPITAKSFEESAKLLLDPTAQNSRANSLYTGSFVVANAEAYLKQGKYGYSGMISADFLPEEYVAVADMVKNADGNYAFNGKDMYINLDDGGAWGSELSLYYEYGYLKGYEDDYKILADAANEKGYTPINETTLKAVSNLIAALHGYKDAEAYAADAGDYAYQEWEEMGFYGYDMPAVDWADVGVFAVSDYELVYVITKPLSGFYLKYSMPSFLVHADTYNSLAKVDSEGIYTNTYGTSAETTMSYGPYKLTYFQRDKLYILERNENYYGLTEDTYQTTHINVQYVADAATRLQLFLSGELDSYGLQKDDMKTYQLSDHTYYYTGSSLYAIAFNPDYDVLVEKQKAAGENINKTILTIDEFRQAFSFSLDRKAFALATSPTNNAAFALYSSLIVSDPEAGTAYRTTDAAKRTLVNFWGLADDIGEGKLYADMDEAIESITGYNLTKAQQLFNTAYDKAIELGYMTENDKIEICIGLPSATATFYTQGYDFLVNNYQEAVKGTKLEGKLTFTKDDTIGNAFGDRLRDNSVDMLFGVGFTGSALDPYGLMEVWVDDPSLQYDVALDYATVDLTINIKGTDYTTDCKSWLAIMNGTAKDIFDADGNKKTYSCGSSDNDPETRLEILAALENAVLMNYNFIPIIDSSSASLKGMQIQYKTEEYIFGLGFGGIKYYTYNYSDAEWKDFVASNGGELDYT